MGFFRLGREGRGGATPGTVGDRVAGASNATQPATRSPLEGPRTTRLGRAAASTTFASSRGRGRGANEGTPKRRRSRARDEKGEISAGREGGADASGARGALGNSPAARAFATRGAVAPILPAKETVRAAILTLRVCVLKWMTAGRQKSSWRLLSSSAVGCRESRRSGREMGTVDPGPRFRSASDPVLKKSQKKRFGTKLADRPLLACRVKYLLSQRQLGKELSYDRQVSNFKIRTHLSNYHVVPDRAPV